MTLKRNLPHVASAPKDSVTFAAQTPSARKVKCLDSLDGPSYDKVRSSRLRTFESHVVDSKDYVHAARWCVTLEDLVDFEGQVRKQWEEGRIPDNAESPNVHHSNPEIGPNIYQVTEHFIKPQTKRAGCSWALMRHPTGLQCDVFATHSWSEGVFEFVNKVRSAWPQDARHIWICFLANPQNGDVSRMLGDNIWQSPFCLAVQAARYMLVIPNSATSIYTRLWCVFEAYEAVKAVKQRDLAIILPRPVRHTTRAVWVVTGILLNLLSMCLSIFLLRCFKPVRDVANMLGPFMWLFATWVLSRIVDGSIDSLVVDNRGVGIRIAVHLFNLITLSMGGVFAWAHLLHYLGGNWFSDNLQVGSVGYESGETDACMQLAVVYFLMHQRTTILIVARFALSREAKHLHYDTVLNATCSCKQDEVKIKEAVKDSANEIDRAIRMLKELGRYDRSVQENLANGVSIRHVRAGFDRLRVMNACQAWSFWWTTDLSSRGHRFWALLVPIIFYLVVIFPLQERFIGTVGRGRAIFAVDAALWGGNLYVMLTILMEARSGRHGMKHKRVSLDSVSLQLACLIAVGVVCACHYWGFLNWRRRKAPKSRTSARRSRIASDREVNVRTPFLRA